jgi:hypothetical protein
MRNLYLELELLLIDAPSDRAGKASSKRNEETVVDNRGRDAFVPPGFATVSPKLARGSPARPAPGSCRRRAILISQAILAAAGARPLPTATKSPAVNLGRHARRMNAAIYRYYYQVRDMNVRDGLKR